MDGLNNMAQSQATTQRPPFSHQQSSFRRDYASAGRPNPFSPQSPQTNLPYSSPSPQPFSPQISYAQPPAAKRPRLSPEVQPSNSPNYSPVMRPGSTPNGLTVNGHVAGPPRAGLMAPPQRPAERNQEDQKYEDLLTASGVNQEEEWRTLTTQRSVGYPGGVDGVNSAAGFSNLQGSGVEGQQQPTPEQLKLRDEERADWEASRRSQNPLWDAFLWTGSVNEKIRQTSATERLIDPQSGVLVNTQKHAPPPSVRVDGLEGASKVIDQGQSILTSATQGERLTEMLKLISLATKARLTGVLGAAARLSHERREYSKGKIPDDWVDVAVRPKSNPEAIGTEVMTSPETSSSLKRTHAQMNEDSRKETDDVLHPAATVFNQSADAEHKSEAVRLARRAKRKAVENADKAQAAADAEAAEVQLAAALEADSKKTTKKQQKVLDTKFTEQQQHKSTNEAARLATSSLFGRFGSKKGKSYAWMSGGGTSGTATPSSTPSKPPPGASAGTIPAPSGQRPAATSKPDQLPIFDEDKDPGIQVRDVLLVLEWDARAPRSYLRGYSAQDN